MMAGEIDNKGNKKETKKEDERMECTKENEGQEVNKVTVKENTDKGEKKERENTDDVDENGHPIFEETEHQAFCHWVNTELS